MQVFQIISEFLWEGQMEGSISKWTAKNLESRRLSKLRTMSNKQKQTHFLVCVYQGWSSFWMVEIEPHSYISSSRSVTLYHELVVNVDGVKGSASTGLYWELFNSRDSHRQFTFEPLLIPSTSHLHLIRISQQPGALGRGLLHNYWKL